MPTKPDISIGSFQKPTSAPLLTQEKKATTKAESVQPDSVEIALSQEAQETEEQLKPLESYEVALKKAAISKEEAAAIVDDLLLKGFYSEAYSLTSRISVRFRSRNYSDTLRINTALEVLKPTYQVGYEEMVYRYSLASSLETLGSTSFVFGKATDTREQLDKYFNDRLSYIETLPEMTVHLLYAKLSKFDDKIRTVLKEGAIENF